MYRGSVEGVLKARASVVERHADVASRYVCGAPQPHPGGIGYISR